jgi:hypothetical protein
MHKDREGEKEKEGLVPSLVYVPIGKDAYTDRELRKDLRGKENEGLVPSLVYVPIGQDV